MSRRVALWVGESVDVDKGDDKSSKNDEIEQALLTLLLSVLAKIIGSECRQTSIWLFPQMEKGRW